MRIAIWTLFLLPLSVAPGIAGITVDRKQETDFNQYSSFAWMEAKTSSEQRSDPEFLEAEELIRRAISNELTSRGIREVSEDPDLLIRSTFVVREEERDDVDILEDDGRWGATGDVVATSGQPGEYVREIDMGTLTVDLLDGYSKLEVWRAIATAVVRPRANKRSEKRINKVVGKMFESYPVE